MSKQIKQMEMDSLKNTFKDVRDMVVLSVSGGVDCHLDNALRHSLRKKKIRLQVIKNSLSRRVFGELGLKIGDNSPFWHGPSLVAWGADSVKDLSVALEHELKDLVKKQSALKDKITIKTALADGEEITFEQARKRPSRAEALGRVISLAMSPGSRLLSQILGPAARVASQIKTVSEKPAEAEAAPPVDAAAAPAAAAT